MVALNWDVFLNFLIAIALGAIIGMEREVEQQKNRIVDFAGLRTFIFITMLGALTGYLSTTFFKSHIFIYIAFISFTLLAIASYSMLAYTKKKVGATTEVTAILGFMVGLMVLIGFRDLAVVITVLIAVFLALRPELHAVARRIEKAEIFAGLEFAVISLVILPFLPNHKYSPMDLPVISKLVEAIPAIPVDLLAQLDVFNPYKIWLMVVFISGVSFVGYILSKMLGAERGIGLTGILGGLASSTAVTTSISQESKKYPTVVYPFVFAVLVACSTMFFRVLFEVLVVNPALFKPLAVPLAIMGFIGLGAAFFLYTKTKEQKMKKLDLKSPFALIPAIKFALFFTFVLVISKLAQILFGENGVYIASFLSGFADVDVVAISAANLAASGDLSASAAVIAIIIGASTNTLMKGGIAYFTGSKKFGITIAAIFSMIIIAGVALILFI
jgi:uncharacterized membrane protein (DUF4010 family)